jgi:hypothetical protein
MTPAKDVSREVAADRWAAGMNSKRLAHLSSRTAFCAGFDACWDLLTPCPAVDQTPAAPGSDETPAESRKEE